MGADRGGTAIGRLEYQRRPEAASMPVRLAPRPVFLAGRETLLAELDARLAEARAARAAAGGLVRLGGAGKTSVAVEYAHRHLAEVGVCWQFAAEDPAVLAATSACWPRNWGHGSGGPAGSGHFGARGAGPVEAEWLVVFDNV